MLPLVQTPAAWGSSALRGEVRLRGHPDEVRDTITSCTRRARAVRDGACARRVAADVGQADSGSPLRWISRRSNSREVRRYRSQVPHWSSRELCRLAPHNQRSLPPQKTLRNRVRPASASSHKAPTRAATVSGLARTGADAGPAIGIGILLAALGGGLILVSCRRRRRS